MKRNEVLTKIEKAIEVYEMAATEIEALGNTDKLCEEIKITKQGFNVAFDKGRIDIVLRWIADLKEMLIVLSALSKLSPELREQATNAFQELEAVTDEGIE